jgi:glycosyltransferase involved in cell wall biosynthesis
MAGPSVEFLGALSNGEIADLYFEAKAFVFPGVEDFGITPLEAMAAGTPVIAYKKGGALDTVTAESGVFFEPQTAHALSEVIADFERGAYRFDLVKVRAQAEKFSRERFRSAFLAEIRKAWSTRGKPQAELEAVFTDLVKI